jgi:hypothetical protein
MIAIGCNGGNTTWNRGWVLLHPDDLRGRSKETEVEQHLDGMKQNETNQMNQIYNLSRNYYTDRKTDDGTGNLVT